MAVLLCRPAPKRRGAAHFVFILSLFISEKRDRWLIPDNLRHMLLHLERLLTLSQERAARHQQL